MNSADARDTVASLYRSILKREPDIGGLVAYSTALAESNMTLENVVEHLLQSAEYKSLENVQSVSSSPTACGASEAMDVFVNFSQFLGSGRDGYITNFLGGVTATKFVNIPAMSGSVEKFPIPRNFHAETIEWFGTLRAVLEARDTFNMIELGAGWAPWCTIGYIAAEQRGLRPHVTAIEGDAGHVRFIEESFKVNGHDLNRCRILHGIVGPSDGEASFPRVVDGSRAYGGAARFQKSRSDDHYQQFIKYEANLIEKIDVLKCYSIKSAMQIYDHVDLIHCDIQGAEIDVFEAGLDSISEKTSWVIIGTHSFDIDRRLSTLFARAGWTCKGLEAAKMIDDGGILRLTSDGTQLWKNDRFS